MSADVTAVIVTRGDVDLKEILKALPEEWDVLVWDNGAGSVSHRVAMPNPILARIVTGKGELPDLGVYGRFAAIEYAKTDLIYVQDDDCIVSDPHALVHAYLIAVDREDHDPNTVVCNMPANFRARHFYDEHSLIGFGGVFHRDAPQRAFSKFWEARQSRLGLQKMAQSLNPTMAKAYEMAASDPACWPEDFQRTCDIIFTALAPRVLVDVEYIDMPWASADNRMWKQPWHQAVRDEMLKAALEARDA